MVSPRRIGTILAAALTSAAIAACWPDAEPGGGRRPERSPEADLQAAAPAVVLEPVVSNLASPVFVTHAGDGSGRLFVVEQPGVIKVLRPGATTPSTFLDLQDRVLFGGERGLLGLAFHPDYGANGRLFVDYTRKPDGATVVAEYRRSTSDPDAADRGETVMLTVSQPFANHNGGMIAFGPDGRLYIALGDGGSANDPGDRAQNVNELLGKILRIDVDHPVGPTQPYSSPADNPFAGPAPGRDEIYALGFRNPWRFSFDRLTGDLMAADVGQNAREEVDRVVRGGNYGWRTFEGSLCTELDPPPCDASGFIPPIAEYDNAGARCAVTGGYVYRGSGGGLPSGAYLFGDYCSGELFLLENGRFDVIADTGLLISSFGEDEEGALYVVDHGGAVHRLAATSCIVSVAPPGLAFSVAGGTGVVSVTVTDGCAWTASSSAAWISITGGDSGSGDGAVTYVVAPNPGRGARTGTVTVAGRVHTVAQAGVGRCALTVDPRRVLLGSEGGQGTVAVTAEDGCAWSATCRVEWITLSSAGGVGNGVVTYNVAPNATGPARRARLVVGGRTTWIRQE